MLYLQVLNFRYSYNSLIFYSSEPCALPNHTFRLSTMPRAFSSHGYLCTHP